MDPEDKELDTKITERFKQLPKPVRDAITSADVEKRMRELADTQKLHLDQWESLENEVMLALLGFQPVEDLQQNIKSEVSVTDEMAKSLAQEISKIVFEPVREQLERELEHPEAKAVTETGVEKARDAALQAEKAPEAPVAPQVPSTAPAAQATPPPVAPATPPAPPNQDKAVRAPVSETYKSGQASTQRKEVHEDPYREPPA